MVEQNLDMAIDDLYQTCIDFKAETIDDKKVVNVNVADDFHRRELICVMLEIASECSDIGQRMINKIKERDENLKMFMERYPHGTIPAMEK